MRVAACLLPLAFANGQDLFLEKNVEYDADVIVIGAGWSGMAAADHLHKAGVNLMVLEADSRTGGRTMALEFGSESVGKFIFEQGSNWVCGSGLEKQEKGNPAVLSNPVRDLMYQENLQVAFIPGATDGNMTNYYKVYDENGVNMDASGELRDRGNAALACLARIADSASVKVNVRTGLTRCGWKPETDAEWAMDWAIVSDESGVLAKHGALVGFGPDPTYTWWGADDWLVVDQHPRGFARLVDGMVKDTVPSGDSRVKLNTKVSNIAWGAQGATISATDGRTFKAKHVITTMSLGVVRKHHEELFTPNLPRAHKQDLADNHIPMANLTHVLIQFPSVWWDNTIPAWVSANAGGKDSRGNFTAWHNLNMEGFIPGSNTLLSFIGEPQASLYGAMTEAEIMPIVMERLRAQNPDITIPEASAAWLKNWGVDPLHYGAYSYSEPGVSYKRTWAKALKHNGKSIVQFAGEATCDNLNGYTHGALQSGKEAAARYLHEFEKGPNPEQDDALNLCNFYYYS